MLLKLAYLGVMSALALLRLLPMSDRKKDAEMLALRHQITAASVEMRRSVPPAAWLELWRADHGPRFPIVTEVGLAWSVADLPGTKLFAGNAASPALRASQEATKPC
ncbi:hypothetical protein [Streptomyces chiangmaiensis]|uniref:Uncharacterized protein n=1 Tax=Streptomyces chiangmaiensis TaxID=766497 RepID=A0ABU7FNY0_9ACTN|nr:hypothetical protein [Streptomyces chiangmaiensis]MED7825821.1 hypothetical protein [Streptomyces chiangmaiensis]